MRQGARLIRPDGVGTDDVKRAYCQVGAAEDTAMRPQDFNCDVAVAMERFPVFPATG